MPSSRAIERCVTDGLRSTASSTPSTMASLDGSRRATLASARGNRRPPHRPCRGSRLPHVHAANKGNPYRVRNVNVNPESASGQPAAVPYRSDRSAPTQSGWTHRSRQPYADRQYDPAAPLEASVAIDVEPNALGDQKPNGRTKTRTASHPSEKTTLVKAFDLPQSLAKGICTI